MKMEYGPEERTYLTQRKLKMSSVQWEVCRGGRREREGEKCVNELREILRGKE